jgi:hypothetical protein
MKKTIDEKISDVLDVTPTEIVAKPVAPAIKKDTVIDGTDDYEYARNNLKGLIENGKEAMENILFLAKEGESARTYEVVGQLIKTLADTNKDLLDLAKKSKELKTEKEEKSGGTQIQNALFVGSTAELQKLINKQ